jgi:hypothetical protein
VATERHRPFDVEFHAEQRDAVAQRGIELRCVDQSQVRIASQYREAFALSTRSGAEGDEAAVG